MMYIKEFIFNMKGVEIFQIPNFLSDYECDHLCRLIDEHSIRSTVAGQGEVIHDYSQDRTSSSADFPPEDQIANTVNQRLADEIGSPITHAEPLFGHVYRVGEEFKDHTDYFAGDSYINHCLASGQRTWTAMVYLNDVELGGHTEFPEIGKSFAPKKGTALFWKNADGKGSENPATLHSGLPVIEGSKYILTKWFREFAFQPEEDMKRAEAHHEEEQKEALFVLDKKGNQVPIKYVDGIPHALYASHEDIPALTEEGFKKMPIPKSLYYRILAYYHEGLENIQPEFDPQKNDDLVAFISSKEVRYPTEIIWMNDELVRLIFEGLEETLSQWAGKRLGATHCYGIRTYKRGAQLKKHIDGWQTRIVSAILNIDQEVDEPWALQIDDHQGVEHEVFLKPGEMVLYESAVLHHGRVKPLQGEYYTNLFVHYVHLN